MILLSELHFDCVSSSDYTLSSHSRLSSLVIEKEQSLSHLSSLVIENARHRSSLAALPLSLFSSLHSWPLSDSPVTNHSDTNHCAQMLFICQDLMLGTPEPEDRQTRGGHGGLKLRGEVGQICFFLIVRASGWPEPGHTQRQGHGGFQSSQYPGMKAEVGKNRREIIKKKEKVQKVDQDGQGSVRATLRLSWLESSRSEKKIYKGIGSLI